MNKIIAAILIVIVGVMCVYELMCIHELRRDVEKLSEDIQQLNGMREDIQRLNGNMQEMNFQIKSVNKAVDLILTELWLVRPQVPDPRPWQVKE